LQLSSEWLFLDEKPLGGRAFWVYLLWFGCTDCEKMAIFDADFSKSIPQGLKPALIPLRLRHD